jgi:hypothetical protein
MGSQALRSCLNVPQLACMYPFSPLFLLMQVPQSHTPPPPTYPHDSSASTSQGRSHNSWPFSGSSSGGEQQQQQQQIPKACMLAGGWQQQTCMCRSTLICLQAARLGCPQPHKTQAQLRNSSMSSNTGSSSSRCQQLAPTPQGLVNCPTVGLLPTHTWCTCVWWAVGHRGCCKGGALQGLSGLPRLC